MLTALEQELQRSRDVTDNLFSLVNRDAFYERPIPERHRILFYLGHLEAFDWNLLGRRALDLRTFHPTFDRLFAFGIDPAEGNLPTDQPSDWPAVEEVETYNARVRQTLDASMSHVPEELIHAAIEHRLMHAETLAYIFHQLPESAKSGYPMAEPASPPPQPRVIPIATGIARLGAPREAPFAWDNEYEEHCVPVPEFAVANYKVTNAEYLALVRAGGEVPPFWTERNGAWFYRGMFGETPLAPDAPVYVTRCQAEAYAKWRGMRLPTEAEFHRAADGLPPSQNADFAYWDPISVTADGLGETTPVQMTGNGWEWTSTVFSPFPGFRPRDYYENYSAPFFDGQHYVLKGASPRTAARFLRPSFRNWFRPSYPYIYATFRLVQS